MRPSFSFEIALREFGPNWFTVTMGTGIVALSLAQLTKIAPFLGSIGAALWIVNIALFLLFAVLTIARIVRWPDIVGKTLSHPVQSMFIGAIPMGFATIVNGFVTFGPQFFGERAYEIAYWCWIADVVASVASGLIVPFFMFTLQELALEKMTAVWLLPIVPAEVAAASAGGIALHVSPSLQNVLLVSGALLWAFSVPLALAILAIVFLRLATAKLPGKELAVSGWLTIGPLGTGSLAATLLGHAGTAQGFLAVGLVVGLVLWAYGAWWWTIGIFGTLYHARRELPFNMGWWGFTFPLGVYTAATYSLANVLHSSVFFVIAAVLTILLVALWLVVVMYTARGVYTGQIFQSAPASPAPLTDKVAA
jgi:C4-dicarboxylate transporter/malic acid transport protein